MYSLFNTPSICCNYCHVLLLFEMLFVFCSTIDNKRLHHMHLINLSAPTVPRDTLKSRDHMRQYLGNGAWCRLLLSASKNVSSNYELFQLKHVQRNQ